MHSAYTDNRFSALLWLALAVVLCYANALGGDFQFDDYNVIVNNPQVHSWSNWFEGLPHGIRPLLKFSYTLDWTMGAGAIGFHLSNLLIHLVNAYLVYLLAHEFVRQQWRASALQHAPLFAALLFAVHPIHTEAVTYICGRSTALMTLFYLAGLFCYVSGRTQQNNSQYPSPPPYRGRAREGVEKWTLLNSTPILTFPLQGGRNWFGADPRSQIKVYGLTPLFFILALSIKETAVTFPFALLLWEYTCGGRWQPTLRSQWPSWLVLAAGAVVFLFSASYLAHMERSAQLNSLQGNIATQLSAFVYLLRQWAAPLWLNIDPELILLRDFSVSALPLLFLAALCALILACLRNRPWLSFALAWAMLQLLPLHLFLPRLDIANERQMYLAGWPLFLALAIELTLWLDTKTLRLVAAALLLALASLTVLRNRDYRDEISLWQSTVAQSPHKARVHNNLGYAYLLAHRYGEARQEFNAALQLDPGFYRARYNLERLEEVTSTIGKSSSGVVTESSP
jgi:hypothetical protein